MPLSDRLPLPSVLLFPSFSFDLPRPALRLGSLSRPVVEAVRVGADEVPAASHHLLHSGCTIGSTSHCWLTRHFPRGSIFAFSPRCWCCALAVFLREHRVFGQHTLLLVGKEVKVVFHDSVHLDTCLVVQTLNDLLVGQCVEEVLDTRLSIADCSAGFGQPFDSVIGLQGQHRFQIDAEPEGLFSSAFFGLAHSS